MIMELSIKQKEIVETDAQYSIVLAAAASGKTRCLTERARYLLEHGANPKKLVIITFTNAAAETMRERLGEISKGVYIGTIHGYCNYLLLAGGVDTSDILNDEDFDALFEKIKNHKNVFKTVDNLLLDEAQDSTPMEFEFILDMIKPKSYMFFGDLRQSIYGFRNADPNMLFELSELSEVTTFDLNENYRNGAAILQYGKDFINKEGRKFYDNSICKSNRIGQVTEMVYDLQKIYNLINSKKEYGKWFVLTRSNAQLDEIYQFLKARNVPCDTFKRADLTNAELSEKMKQDTVKVLTVHTAKGLENNYVIVCGCKPYGANPMEERRVCYVAITRAMDKLYWCKTGNKKRKPAVTSWE